MSTLCMRPKILVCLILISSALALVSHPCSSSDVSGKGITSREKRPLITIRLHSRNLLLVTDPQGRRTGTDLRNKKVPFKEIPHSSYKTIESVESRPGYPTPEIQELSIPDPEKGVYILRIRGVANINYALDIIADNAAGEHRILSKPTKIRHHGIHEYRLRYTDTAQNVEDIITLIGAYDGKDKNEPETNELLSYFSLSGEVHESQSNTLYFTPGIIYSKDIDPGSFSATLNGMDVSDCFNPAAGTSEIVRIGPARMDMILTLKIDGNPQSGRSTDIDTLELSPAHKQSIVITDPGTGKSSRRSQQIDFQMIPDNSIISIHSHAYDIRTKFGSGTFPHDLLVIDPSGRWTGKDSLGGEPFTEIPRSSYGSIGLGNLVTGNPGPKSMELEIGRPQTGGYTLNVFGHANHRYMFEVSPASSACWGEILKTNKTFISKGDNHTYHFQYNKDAESVEDIMRIRGAYEGDALEEHETNHLLTYFTCSSSMIELPPGTEHYALGIWYYVGMDTETFSATLNGKDVSELFKPEADRNEIITLDISQGNNSLVLTIEGDVSFKKNIDTDTFEIIVMP